MKPESPSSVTTRHPDRSPSLLPPDEIHVWVANLHPASGGTAARLAATTHAERERASRFHRQDDAERYLYAHGVLRMILGEYLASDPLALHFGTHENGKPFLEDGRLQFNLSHSGDLALIAVARARHVGVDVEQVRPMHDLDALAARICTPGELAIITGLADPHRERAFFAMWTRKEALAKATGEGISAVVRDARAAVIEADGRWTLVEMGDIPGYAACVAGEGSRWRLVRRNLTDPTGGR